MVRRWSYTAGMLGAAAVLFVGTQAAAQRAPAEDGSPPTSTAAAEPTAAPPPAAPVPDGPASGEAEPDAPPTGDAEPEPAPDAAEEGSGQSPAGDPTAPSAPTPQTGTEPDAAAPANVDAPPQEAPPPATIEELLAADDIGLGPSDGEGVVSLAEEEDEDDGLPWGQGILVPGIGFGLGFGSDATVLSFSLGAMYYFLDGLAAGLSIGDTIFFYSDELDRDYPGFDDEIPTNIFRITPQAQYVFYRHEHFSPYVFAGVGPVFYNNGGGVVGEWIAGPGIYIGIAGPVALDLGVAFSSIFPEEAWEEAFSYQGDRVVTCNITDSLCSFDIAPRIGLVMSF